MYKNQMTNIPSEYVGEICRKLEALDMHPIHRAYSSMLEGDNDVITILACDNRSEDYEAYSVVDYNCKTGELQRGTNNMSYPDALIEMGNRIKE